jgi:hypothetical protein
LSNFSAAQVEVILGESRLEQVKQNAEATKKGPLPADVVTEI